MKLSARNQLPGVVTKITEGAVNGIVTLDVNGEKVTDAKMTVTREMFGEEGAIIFKKGKKTFLKVEI